MSSYRERLLGNWFSHYQRAETARVRDKRVKKQSTFTLSVYPHIPPCIPSSFSLSLFFFFLSGLFSLPSTESSNHHFVVCSTRNRGCSCNDPPTVYYLKLLIHVNIHLHIVVLCLSLRRTIKKMEFSFTTGKSL